MRCIYCGIRLVFVSQKLIYIMWLPFSVCVTNFNKIYIMWHSFSIYVTKLNDIYIYCGIHLVSMSQN